MQSCKFFARRVFFAKHNCQRFWRRMFCLHMVIVYMCQRRYRFHMSDLCHFPPLASRNLEDFTLQFSRNIFVTNRNRRNFPRGVSFLQIEIILISECYYFHCKSILLILFTVNFFLANRNRLSFCATLAFPPYTNDLQFKITFFYNSIFSCCFACFKLSLRIHFRKSRFYIFTAFFFQIK